MLSFFRSGGAAQVIVAAIAFIIMIVFVVEFRAGGRGSGSIKVECAVKVFDYCADAKEFEANRALAIPSGVEMKALRKMQLDRAGIDGLIERELLVREAEKLGIWIGTDEVDDELEAGRARVSLAAARLEDLSNQLGLCPLVPNPLIDDPERAKRMASCAEGGPRGIRMLNTRNGKTGRFDYKVYERTLRVSMNRSPKEFKEMQTRALVAERMRELIKSNVRVAPEEVWPTYERTTSKAVARYVSIPRDWFAKYAIDLSDAQVADWAKANQDQVDPVWESEKSNFSAGCPLVSEILVSVDFRATDIEKTTKRTQIEDAAKRIRGGEAFASVAKDVSDGKTALLGGRLGCLNATSYGVGADQLLEALKGLEAGKVSPVIESTRGFHLLLPQGTLAEADVEREGRRQVARNLALRFKADTAAHEFATRLIEKAKGGADLEQATSELVRAALAARGKPGKEAKGADEDLPGMAAEDRPKVEVSTPFTRSGSPVPDATGGPMVASKLFEMEKPGIYGTPVETASGVAVVELKEKTLANRADFVKEQPLLIAERRRLKADEAFALYVERLRAAAEAKISVDPRLLEAEQKGEQTGDRPDNAE